MRPPQLPRQMQQQHLRPGRERIMPHQQQPRRRLARQA
jgi:hypothetical protein